MGGTQAKAPPAKPPQAPSQIIRNVPVCLDALALDGLRTDRTSYFCILPAELLRLLPHYFTRELAAYKFNTEKPRVAIAWMIGQGVITDEVDSLASFLSDNQALLDRTCLGMLLDDKERKDLLKSYANRQPMAGQPIDKALRTFFVPIRLPGERLIDGILSAFAERYVAENPDHPEVKSTDTAFLVAYGIVILSADLWKPNRKDRPQKDQFERSMRVIGLSVSVAFLHSIYDSYVSRVCLCQLHAYAPLPPST